MTLRTDQRQAARAGARKELIDAGLDREEAEHWCNLWEREAARHGLVGGPYYWDAGRGWIDAQLAAVARPRRQAENWTAPAPYHVRSTADDKARESTPVESQR
jgi:hypothetical protein